MDQTLPLAGLESQPQWLRQVVDGVLEIGHELGNAPRTVDQEFISFLRTFAQFGYFTFGPVTIDAGLVEDLFWRTAPRGDGRTGNPDQTPGYVSHLSRFWEEFRKSGRARLEPVHLLLAYMRCPDGLVSRVFGELGVSADAVRAYAEALAAGQGERSFEGAERLYSTEEAAAYFNVHIQTVRVWIRSGKLPAFRLAGQKSLRIRENDLKAVLEPTTPSDLTETDEEL